MQNKSKLSFQIVGYKLSTDAEQVELYVKDNDTSTFIFLDRKLLEEWLTDGKPVISWVIDHKVKNSISQPYIFVTLEQFWDNQNVISALLYISHYIEANTHIHSAILTELAFKKVLNYFNQTVKEITNIPTLLTKDGKQKLRELIDEYSKVKFIPQL